MPIQLGTESNLIESRARWFASPQAAGGTLAVPVGAAVTDSAGGPIRALPGSSIDVTQSRALHGMTKEGTREYVGSTYTSMRDVPWTLKTRIIPPPDLDGTLMPEPHHLTRAAFGARTINAGTSIVYTAADIVRPNIVSLARLFNEGDPIFGEWLRDCVVAKWTLRWQGGQPPEMEYSGKAAGYVAASRTQLAAAVVSSTTITIDDADALQVGARVTIGGDDNSGAGYLVTARTNATTFVVGTSLSAADNAVVVPFMPAPTYSDQEPLGAVVGGVTLGGVQIPLQGIEFSIDNQVAFIEDELGTESFSDGVPGDQALLGKLTLRATRDEVARHVGRQRFGTSALLLSCGDGAANRDHVFSWPQIEAWVSPVQPGPVSTTTVDFRALDSVDDAGDAFTYTVS